MRRIAFSICLVLALAALHPAHAQPAPATAGSLPASEGEGAPAEEAAPAQIAAPAPKAAPVPAPAAPAQPKTFNAVRLQGLNKVTARIYTIDAPLGIVTRFENLEIIARKCWQAPPEAQPENAALLEVRELKSGEAPQDVFKGWMFSSSPALSSLEHPVYDLTVIACENIKTPE